MKIKLIISLLLISLIINLCGFVGLASDTGESVQTKILTLKVRKQNIDIFIPQISNLKDKKIESKINLILKDKALSFVDFSARDTSFSNQYKIKYNKDNIISVLFSEQYYTVGAAHGYYMYDSLTINLDNGYIYNLKDFYGTNKDYKAEISKIINYQANEKVKSGEVSLIQVNTIEVGEENFYLSDNYIVLYYNPYEIAPFADGIIEFYIDKNLNNDKPVSKIPGEITKENLNKIFSLTKDDIIKLYGNPDDSGMFEGAYYYIYEKDNITFFFELTDTDNPRVISIAMIGNYSTLGIKIGTTTADVKKLLGKPHWEGVSLEDTTYCLSYSISNYDILFGLDETNSKVEFIQIKQNS